MTVDCKRTCNPSRPSERYKINLRCKGSPHFATEENNWFPCKVLRTKMSEITVSEIFPLSEKYILNNLCYHYSGHVGRRAIL